MVTDSLMQQNIRLSAIIRSFIESVEQGEAKGLEDKPIEETLEKMNLSRCTYENKY